MDILNWPNFSNYWISFLFSSFLWWHSNDYIYSTCILVNDIACFPVYSVSFKRIQTRNTFKHTTKFSWKIIVHTIYFYEKYSLNIDCLQTLTSFSNNSCNSGSHRRIQIYSVNLIDRSHVMNDVIKQVIVLFQYCLLYTRFSLISHMTPQNNCLESCLRRKVKWVK